MKEMFDDFFLNVHFSTRSHLGCIIPWRNNNWILMYKNTAIFTEHVSNTCSQASFWIAYCATEISYVIGKESQQI